MRRAFEERCEMECSRRGTHPLRTEIGCIGQGTGQQRSDIPRGVACADMGEVMGNTRPLMHFPQEIRNFDQRIHLADLRLQFFGCRRNFAPTFGALRLDPAVVGNQRGADLLILESTRRSVLSARKQEQIPNRRRQRSSSTERLAGECDATRTARHNRHVGCPSQPHRGRAVVNLYSARDQEV